MPLAEVVNKKICLIMLCTTTKCVVDLIELGNLCGVYYYVMCTSNGKMLANVHHFMMPLAEVVNKKICLIMLCTQVNGKIL